MNFYLLNINNNYILVNDEKIEKDDYYIAWETNYFDEPKERWVIYNRTIGLNGKNQKKIIAGYGHLPAISIM